jgi:FAD/FMN-containing dehydrogenase
MAVGTLQKLTETLSSEVIVDTHPRYDETRKVWNGLIDHRPAAIVRCGSADDVARTIEFTRGAGLPLSVRCGGHNVAGSSVCDGGIVIDLSLMRTVSVHEQALRATVGGGALWADVDGATSPHGLATTGGLISHTGVGGLTLGGGIGWLMRRYGLACDNLTGAEVLTADGRVLRANDQDNPDLYWALRGGGGNFGVVTEFEFSLHPVSTVLAGMVMFDAKDAPAVLRAYRDYVDDCPDELTTMTAFITAPPAPFVPPDVVGRPVVAVLVCHCGDVASAHESVAPIPGFAAPLVQMLAPMPYSAWQGALDEGAPHGILAYWRTEFLGGLSDAVIDVLVDHASRDPSPLGQVHVHHLEGAVARVGEHDTAFARRYAPFLVNIPAGWFDPAETEQNVSWVRDFSDALRPLSTGEAYTNFVGTDELQRVDAAFGVNLDRLRQVKRTYDPDHVFRGNLSIAPPVG